MLRHLTGELLKSGRGGELVASTVTINLLSLGSSLYSIHLLNRYVGVGLTPTLITLTVGVLLAIVFELVLRKLRQRVLADIATKWDHRAGERVFRAFSVTRYEALSGLPLAQRREALGAPMAMQQLGSSNNLSALLDLPFALMFVLATGLLYWPLGLIVLLTCVIVLSMGVAGERRQRSSADSHAKANARVQQMGQFLLAAGEVVRTLPLIGPLSVRWTQVQGAGMSTRREGMDIQAAQQTSVQTVGQVLSVGIYAFGAVAAVQGTITTGALIGASILASRAFAVCSRAAYLADPLVKARHANEALSQLEVLEREPEGGAEPANLQGRLEAVDIAFAYPKQPVPLFERLNFELPVGKVLAVIGPNGAGKSTLIKLLLGLLAPQRGLVRTDGIELRQLSHEWWRGRIGYAPQESVFFDGTLRENLVLDRDIDDARLLDLIREMGLEGFLASDPAGLDRPITSHDTGLAVGVRRRFSLIRAILGDPRVIFLDEPTEGLDTTGQAAVARLLNRLVQEGRTLVVASNENFIQRAADLIVDLSKKPVPQVGVPQPAVPSSPAGDGVVMGSGS
ncbi:MAG: Alpha-hemolysin translocation ATP-binding protein HlyB [Pseudomonadota bacterium]|jgi:ATP-binding cassette subfamily C protein LapB